ncbi:uncharacterized protein LOC142856963 [Microtus pennsylvanicus]|uniref:uncharacterized protein LOC142856963 n=1 Tax=Microtus pennsylvanicus TaxID=10058 RepID=UPI003F6CB6BF
MSPRLENKSLEGMDARKCSMSSGRGDWRDATGTSSPCRIPEWGETARCGVSAARGGNADPDQESADRDRAAREPGRGGLGSAGPVPIPASALREESLGATPRPRRRRTARVRPGSAAPAPPSSPPRPSRGRRPTGNSEPRGPARRAPGGRGRAPRLPRPALLPAKATHLLLLLLLLLLGSLQATGSPAGDALTPSPSPAAATEAARPSPPQPQRPWGAAGGGPALAPPTGPRLRPPGCQLHAESLSQRPRGASEQSRRRCPAPPHTCSPPARRPLARFPVTPAPPPPLRLFHTLSHLSAPPPLALWPSFPTEGAGSPGRVLRQVSSPYLESLYFRVGRRLGGAGMSSAHPPACIGQRGPLFPPSGILEDLC